MSTAIRTRTILLIDDNPEDRATIRRYLSHDPKQTYTLVEVSRGADGLRAYQEAPLDAILLDYYLPDMDGRVFLEALQQHQSGALLPVVVITGQENEDLALESLRRGAVEYITKDGLTAESLRLALHAAIEKGILHHQVEKKQQEFEHTNKLLIEQQAQLRLALEAAHMHTWDIDLRKITARTQEENLDALLTATLPHTNGNSPGKPPVHIHQDDRALVAESLQGAIMGNVPYDLTYRLLKPDDTVRWISTRGNVIRDEFGTPLRLMGVSMDVTSQKQLEEVVRKQQQAFQMIAENSPDIIIRFDAATFRLQYANPAIEPILDMPTEALLGKTFWEVGLPEELCTLFDQALTEVVTTGQPTQFTFQLRGHYYLALLAPEEDTAHQLSSILVISHDITALQTEHQQTEEALQALISVAQALVASPEQLREASPQETQTWMYTAQRLLNVICCTFSCTGAIMMALVPGIEVIDKIITSGFDQATDRFLQETICGQRFSQRFEDVTIPARLRAGEVVDLDVSQPPYREQRPRSDLSASLLMPMRLGRTLVGVIILYAAEQLHEFSQEERMQAAAMGHLAALLIERERFFIAHEEARARELIAQEAARQMDAFLGIVSHELKTPLTSIKANVQLSMRQLHRLHTQTMEQNGIKPEPLASILTLMERAQRQLDKQNRLVNDLLDISRIQADRLELQISLCDMVQIVQEVVEDQRMLTPTRQIDLRTSKLELPVLADAGRLAQVINNYLNNALKYSDASMPIEVHLSVEGQMARVSVTDHGPGLMKDQLQHIWERFYQVAGITVKSGSGIGLGLGLHISKQLIERQGGQVGADSIPGYGSTFWLTLPRAK